MEAKLKLRKETIENLENIKRLTGGSPSDLNPCVTDSFWQERCPMTVRCWESATPEKCPIIGVTKSCNCSELTGCGEVPAPTNYVDCPGFISDNSCECQPTPTYMMCESQPPCMLFEASGRPC